MSNPSGLCKCGCGAKTNLAPHNLTKYGWIKDQPMDYLRGHASRRYQLPPWKEELPLCACGCGNQVTLSKLTNRYRGKFFGQPNKFLPGHWNRPILTCQEEDRGFITPCCIWQGEIDKLGYARRDIGHGTVLVHRQVYIAAHGALEPMIDVHHLCEQHACIRLDHLETWSRSEHLRNHRGISPKKYTEICNALRSGEQSQRAISRRFGVSTSFIWRLRKSLISRQEQLQQQGRIQSDRYLG